MRNMLKKLTRFFMRNCESAKSKVYYQFLSRKKYVKNRVINFSNESILDDAWCYHDENWSRVISRFEDRATLLKGNSLIKKDELQIHDRRYVTIDRDRIIAKIPADSIERWFYLYLRPEECILKNFSWKFCVSRESDFRELQFGFRYRDFYNRYRLRHEDSYFFFDKVLNGIFYNNQRKTYFPMALGQFYEIEIIAFNAFFVLNVNGNKILEYYDPENSFPEGSIAIILWEDDLETNINCTIKHQELSNLCLAVSES